MRLLSMVFILLGVSLAQAQIVFAPAVTYRSVDADQAGAQVVKSSGLIADLRLGYMHSSGLFLGGMYSINNIDHFDDEDKGYSAGPTIGYSHYSGFYTLFTYHIIGQLELGRSTPTQKFTNGMGPQVDLGWVFPLTSSFSLGPQITYKALTYSKQDLGGTETTVDTAVTEINPYIAFWFHF